MPSDSEKKQKNYVAPGGTKEEKYFKVLQVFKPSAPLEKHSLIAGLVVTLAAILGIKFAKTSESSPHSGRALPVNASVVEQNSNQSPTSSPQIETVPTKSRQGFFDEINSSIQGNVALAKAYQFDESKRAEVELYSMENSLLQRLGQLAKERPDIKLEVLETLKMEIQSIAIMNNGPAGHQNAQTLIDTVTGTLNYYDQGLDKATQQYRSK